jgi:hypothetical protein
MAMFRARGARSMAIGFWPGACLCATGATALLLCASLPCPATAQEDHSGLTRASFRRNCVMCHSRAAPEGVAPEILAGLHPEPGLRPAQAMPNVVCWRRCTTCWGPDPTAKGPSK